MCYVITAYVTMKLTQLSSHVINIDVGNQSTRVLLEPFMNLSNQRPYYTYKTRYRITLTENPFLEQFAIQLKKVTIKQGIPVVKLVHNLNKSSMKTGKRCFYQGWKVWTSKKYIFGINNVLNMPRKETETLHTRPESKANITNSSNSSSIYEDVMSKRIDNNMRSEKDRVCNQYVTLNSAMGRTGNHMFQVAALLGTAYKYSLVPVLHLTFPLKRWFDLPINTMNTELSHYAQFSVKHCGIYEHNIERLNVTTNLTIDGFFQSWRYFSGAETIIRDSFKLKDKYVNEARKFLRTVQKSGRQNVCVHVRRGDMTAKTSKSQGYKMADKAFFPQAMRFYRDKFKDVLFIILSDGMAWCKQHLIGDDIVYSPFYELASDMALMTSCDHVIVTSGTFGWWGAWLSRGTTVYYSGFPARGTWLDKNMNKTDYYPADWIGIP